MTEWHSSLRTEMFERMKKKKKQSELASTKNLGEISPELRIPDFLDDVSSRYDCLNIDDIEI
jgi:hypothetical protein